MCGKTVTSFLSCFRGRPQGLAAGVEWPFNLTGRAPVALEILEGPVGLGPGWSYQPQDGDWRLSNTG